MGDKGFRPSHPRFFCPIPFIRKMRLGKVTFERSLEESFGSAFGNPAVQRLGHPGGYNIRKPYNCARTSGDQRTFFRRLSPWADSISNGLPSVTTSIPTCITCSMTLLKIEGSFT